MSPVITKWPLPKLQFRLSSIILLFLNNSINKSYCPWISLNAAILFILLKADFSGKYVVSYELVSITFEKTLPLIIRFSIS